MTPSKSRKAKRRQRRKRKRRQKPLEGLNHKLAQGPLRKGKFVIEPSGEVKMSEYTRMILDFELTELNSSRLAFSTLLALRMEDVPRMIARIVVYAGNLFQPRSKVSSSTS